MIFLSHASNNNIRINNINGFRDYIISGISGRDEFSLCPYAVSIWIKLGNISTFLKRE